MKTNSFGVCLVRLAIIAGLMGAASSASAAILIVQGTDPSESIGDDLAGVYSGGDFYTVPAFDPSLGTLQSVQIDFTTTDVINYVGTMPAAPASIQAGLQGPDGVQIGSAFQTVSSTGTYYFTGSGFAQNVSAYYGAAGTPLHFIGGNTLNLTGDWTGTQSTTVTLTYNFVAVPEASTTMAGGFAMLLGLGTVIRRKSLAC